jgi:hypothetical protein
MCVRQSGQMSRFFLLGRAGQGGHAGVNAVAWPWSGAGSTKSLRLHAPAHSQANIGGRL